MNIRLPVLLSLFFLPLEAFEEPDEAVLLMHKGTCTSCHHQSQRRMGPTYQETADKYADVLYADEILKGVIRNGSENGRMPSNRRLSDGEITTIVDWILALGREASYGEKEKS